MEFYISMFIEENNCIFQMFMKLKGKWHGPISKLVTLES